MERNNRLTTIYIVRHGETEWNKTGLLQGHADSPLTTLGKEQAELIAKELRRVRFDEVFASDLLRAKRTAEIIALEFKLTVKTTQALREQHFGSFAGKPHHEYNQAVQRLLKQYKRVTQKQLSRLKVTPDAESQEEAISRFITFLREASVGFSGKTILVVTHGGVMRHLLIHLGFGTHETLPYGILSNTACVKLESDGVDFFVKETKGINKLEKTNL